MPRCARRSCVRGGETAKVVVVFGFNINPLGGTREGLDPRGAGAGWFKRARTCGDGSRGSRTSRSRGVLVEAKPADALIQVAEEVGARHDRGWHRRREPDQRSDPRLGRAAARPALEDPAPRRSRRRRRMSDSAAAPPTSGSRESSSASTRRSPSTGSRWKSHAARSSPCSGRRGAARRRRCA